LCGRRRWVARNTVVGDRRVWNVTTAEARHVTSDAIVSARLSLFIDQGAGAILMARLALTPVIVDPFLRLRQPMRRVTAPAAHLSLRPLVATAGAQLLHTADEVLVFRLLGWNKHGPDHLPGQPRPVVEEISAALEDAPLAFQMALLADPVEQVPRES